MDNKRTKKNSLIRTIFAVVQLLVLLSIIVGIPAYIWFFKKDIITDFNSLEEASSYLLENKSKSVLIYIGIEIIQIVVSVIPGQFFQFAAGYVFGFFQGLLYSTIGVILGTTISFYIGKLMGASAVRVLLGDITDEYLRKLNSRKAYNIVFLIYLIPGIPKDIVSYIAGISNMKAKTFIIVSLLGRVPGMAGSLIIGSLYYHGHYITMGIIVAVAIVFFLLGLIYRKKISSIIDNFYEKIS